MSLFNCDPAAFPKTSATETTGIAVFEYLIDHSRIKSFINKHDKIPNHDGHLELTSETNVPVGTIQVQMKILEDKDLSNPKYQCDRKFLAYCEQHILPVIIFVVNINNDKVFWHHVDKPTLKSLSKAIKTEKQSISLKFKNTNVISKGGGSLYIDEWISIIKNYQDIITNFDERKNRYVQLKNTYEELNNRSNKAVGIYQEYFVQIQLFMDEYNYLLDYDFKCIKNIMYPYFWKIGIGLSNYTNTSISYAFYHIPYGYNDVLIKEYAPENIPKLDKLLSFHVYNRNNPIQDSYKNYAIKLIQKMVIDTIKKHPLLIKEMTIAIEYIFSFLRAHRHLIYLDNIESIELGQIDNIINITLPLIVENASKLNPAINQDYIVDLGYIPYVLRDNFINVINNTKLDIQNNILPQHNYKISLIDTNPQILLQFLLYLKEQRQINNIKLTQLIIKEQYFAPYSIEIQTKILADLKTFYEKIPLLYDTTVKEFFPTLFNEIKFFSDFDVLIVIVDFSRSEFTNLPSLKYHKLKRLEHSPNISYVHVFHEEDDNNLFKNNIKPDGTIVFNNYNYVYNGWSVFQCDFIIKPTPTIYYIQNTLAIKLNDYFVKIGGDLIA